MNEIKERAKWFADTFIESLTHGAAYRGYVLGATEQKAIDIEKACEWLCENIDDYARIGEDGAWVEHSVVRDFKKIMEG